MVILRLLCQNSRIILPATSRYKAALLFIALLAFSHCVTASNLKVTLADSKTGRPLRGKRICVSFNPEARGNGIDKPNVCEATDANGTISISLPNPAPQLVHVAVLTNNLLPCFAIPHAFLVADLIAKGGIAANSCKAATKNPGPEPGRLLLFAHQMTFKEVLKNMWEELL